MLGHLGDYMDLGQVEEAGPWDRQIVEYGALSLKRARSPPASTSLSPCGVPPSLENLPVVLTSADSAIGKVCLLEPCMDGKRG